MKKSIENILIKEIILGNKKSEEKLYKIYIKKINQFLNYKYPKNPDHDDDVCEIVYKIIDNLEKYEENKSSFKTWSYTLAENYMIDKDRKRKIDIQYVEFTLPHDDYENTILFMEPKSNDINPHDQLEIKDYLKHTSESINPKVYNMFNLKYNEGYNYKEIGNMFNMDSTEVCNKLSYVKSKLKKRGL